MKENTTKFYFANYSNRRYRKAQKFSNAIAQSWNCFDKIFSYSPKDLDADFAEKNKDILKCKRGAGYWIWKPYVILKALNKINDNDYLLYCDSGRYLVDNPQNLLNLYQTTSQDVIVYEIPYFNKDWTKRDVFVKLNCDTPRFTDCKQVDGGVILIRKSKQSVSFIREWLSLCEQKDLIDDLPNRLDKPDYEGFQHHRHDQSLLTIVVSKHNLCRFRDSEVDKDLDSFPNSPYPLMIVRTYGNVLPEIFTTTRFFLFKISNPVFKRLGDSFVFKYACIKILKKICFYSFFCCVYYGIKRRVLDLIRFFFKKNKS